MGVAFLVVLVGIFSLNLYNTIQRNNKIVREVLEIGILLDESLIELLELTQTENIEDYLKEKSDYEQIRAEFDALNKKAHEESEKELQALGFNIEAFHKDTDEIAKVSNKFIARHKRKLAKIKEFAEKKKLGRSEQELEKIIAEQKIIETQEHLVLRELQELITSKKRESAIKI